MSIYFITGTDTGVGKTYITAQIAKQWNSKYKLGVVKAVQTGHPDSDLAVIAKTAKLKKAQTFCPIKLKYPLAPQQAAELEKVPPIDAKKLVRDIKEFACKFDICLVEGAGGLYVPIRKGYYMLDLIRDLKAEVILVSRTGLGTINHTLLSVQALKGRVKGIIYNTTVKLKSDFSAQLNPYVLEEATGIKTLAVVSYGQSLPELRLN